MATGAQVRAARGLLGWTQGQLAEAADVAVATVKGMEAGRSRPRRATVQAIQRALEAAGVEFTNGDQPGVRMRRQGGEG